MAYLLKGSHVIDPQCGLDETLDVLIEGSYITQVSPHIEAPAGAITLDLTGKILFPGLCDMHVHLREPGQELKEDIESGTRAAVAGGFTDVCCMPNTKPVIDNALGVAFIKSKAEEVGHCNVHVAGACSVGLEGETLSEMGDMVKHGAVAFTDDGRGIQGAGMMRRVMEYASMFNKTVMVHCQDEDLVGDGQVNEGPASTRLGMLGWPKEGEEIEIARDIILCKLTGCPLHIQHLTTKAGLDMVKAAKAEGLPVTCEVTPHHLFLSDEDITDRYNTNFKVNPPLRSLSDAQALIKAVQAGDIDAVATDHAPHTDFEKEREFELAPFGMIGLETALSLMYTKLVKPGLLEWSELVNLMAVGPRKILRLEPVSITPGSVASITIFNPELNWTVTEDGFESKAKNSAFIGHNLCGRATEVFCEGVLRLKNSKVAYSHD